MIEDPVRSPSRDNTTTVVPVFESKSEILTEKEAYPLLSLVADIGGILRLFLGFNFLMVWGWLVCCVKYFVNKI